jgi:hypothetical protein
MLKHTGGETVKGGFYWSAARRRLEVVSATAGPLPGDVSTTYVRVPVLLMIPLALAMSVVFVIFLPLIGFAVVLESIYKNARVAVPGWLHRVAPVRPVVTK